MMLGGNLTGKTGRKQESQSTQGWNIRKDNLLMGARLAIGLTSIL
jgi:hypothetical protein